MPRAGTRPIIAAIAVAIGAVAGACAHPHPAPASPLAPSRAHAIAPRVATFAPTISASAEVREVRFDRAPRERGPGALGNGQVLTAIRAREPSLHRCFLAALRLDPALRSIKVPVRLRIGARGGVDFAHADGGPARLDECVAAVVRRMSFPPPGARVDLEVPILFRAT